MAKNIQKSVKQKKSRSKPVLKALGILLAIIMGVSLLIVLHNHYRYTFNPSQKIATIMPPFAQDNNLEKIDEDNLPAELGSTDSSFYYLYRGTKSMNEMSTLTKAYLEKVGYGMEANYRADDRNCPQRRDCKAINNGYPYWELVGEDTHSNEVYVLITDHDEKFYNTSLNPGQVLLDVNFISY